MARPRQSLWCRRQVYDNQHSSPSPFPRIMPFFLIILADSTLCIASADRRPVDPPPVVQIRVYESDPNGMNKTEVTFEYNANFFLFATLEFARPMVHGRVQGQPTCPVLTGAAVAGTAYLLRPAPAGYFIFPDLSVRHEGYYRLNFHLYEEVKDSKDQDKNWVPPRPNTSRNPLQAGPPQQFMHFRLDVKSEPFTVYSAKKFPGLRQSTGLSKDMASQGCRVRIRRDVRMRRREEKAMEKYGGYDDGHMTPDPSYPGTPIARPRSTSNPSIDGSYGYCATPQHHPPSLHDVAYPAQPYQLPPPSGPPPPPPTGAGAGVGPPPSQQPHLTFGHEQYCAPPAQPPPPPPPQSMSRAGYPSNYPGYPHSRHVSGGGSSDYGSVQVPQLPKYAPDSTSRPQSQRSEQSRASLPSLMSPLDTNTNAAAAAAGGYNSRPTPDYRWPPDSRGGYQTPKLSVPVSPSPPTTAMPQALTADPRLTHPHSVSGGLEQPAVYGPPAMKGPDSYATEPVLSSKRGHADVFDSRHHDEPLYDGQRPCEPSRGRHLAHRDELDSDVMEYHRANGKTVSRHERAPRIR